ncbi:MAG: hypothetical protein ABJB76_06900 [Candidatus Nitrosocosmicus sp.]
MIKINSEIIAGCSLVIMGIIFIGAGMVNSTRGAMDTQSFVIVALGAATVGLGIWTSNYEAKHSLHTHTITN